MEKTSSEMNGKRLSLRQTSNLSRLRNAASVIWTRLQPTPPFVLAMTALVVLLSLSALTGCATHSTPPSVTPQLPSMPPPRQSQPTEPYLNRVQRNIEAWEKRLRDTLPTR